MATRPLTVRHAQTTVTNVARFIQWEKVKISRQTINAQRAAGRWPDEWLSYAGTVNARNPGRGRGAYDDPERFARVMINKPKLYKTPFNFLPAAEDAHRQLWEAAKVAHSMIMGQAAKMSPGMDGTGAFYNSMKVQSPALERDRLENAGEDTTWQIVGFLPYSATLEQNALYHANIGGIIYWAAIQISKRYPQLGVRFIYDRARNLGLPHIYDVPVLTIGSRKAVTDKIVKPGRRYRARDRGRMTSHRRYGSIKKGRGSRRRDPRGF